MKKTQWRMSSQDPLLNDRRKFELPQFGQPACVRFESVKFMTTPLRVGDESNAKSLRGAMLIALRLAQTLLDTPQSFHQMFPH
jgi:hypothetical protein